MTPYPDPLCLLRGISFPAHLDLSSLHVATRMSVLSARRAQCHLFQVLQHLLPPLRPMLSLFCPPGVIFFSFSSNCNPLELSSHSIGCASMDLFRTLCWEFPTYLFTRLTSVHLLQLTSGICCLRKPSLLPSVGQVPLLCSHSSCSASFAHC